MQRSNTLREPLARFAIHFGFLAGLTVAAGLATLVPDRTEGRWGLLLSLPIVAVMAVVALQNLTFRLATRANLNQSISEGSAMDAVARARQSARGRRYLMAYGWLVVVLRALAGYVMGMPFIAWALWG